MTVDEILMVLFDGINIYIREKLSVFTKYNILYRGSQPTHKTHQSTNHTPLFLILGLYLIVYEIHLSLFRKRIHLRQWNKPHATPFPQSNPPEEKEWEENDYTTIKHENIIPQTYTRNRRIVVHITLIKMSNRRLFASKDVGRTLTREEKVAFARRKLREVNK